MLPLIKCFYNSTNSMAASLKTISVQNTKLFIGSVPFRLQKNKHERNRELRRDAMKLQPVRLHSGTGLIYSANRGQNRNLIRMHLSFIRYEWCLDSAFMSPKHTEAWLYVCFLPVIVFQKRGRGRDLLNVHTRIQLPVTNFKLPF